MTLSREEFSDLFRRLQRRLDAEPSIIRLLLSSGTMPLAYLEKLGTWHFKSGDVCDEVTGLEFSNGALFVESEGDYFGPFPMSQDRAALIAGWIGIDLAGDIKLRTFPPFHQLFPPGSEVLFPDGTIGTVVGPGIHDEVFVEVSGPETLAAKGPVSMSSAVVDCPECYGTGYKHGIGFPCSHGCLPPFPLVG